MTFQPGEIVHERYRIIQILATGGMGTVYRAKDESLRVEVALKVTKSLPNSIGRVNSQAAIMAGLHHSNLPRVTDSFSLPTGEQILVMDFVPGEDLKSRVERIGPLPVKEAVVITLAVGAALKYLHTQHPAIIHQDVKPGNIRITPTGQIMLVDFDLLTVVDSRENGTGEEIFGLTPGFAAPEQYNQMAETRSDQYSLAATLFFALTGIRLPDGLTRAAGKPELPGQNKTRSQIPVDILTSLEKALSINPTDRYPDIQSFLDSLKTILNELPNSSKLTTRKISNSATRINKLGVYVSIAVVAISLVSAGFFYYFMNSKPVLSDQVVPIISTSAPIPIVTQTGISQNPETKLGITDPSSTPLIQQEQPQPTPLGGVSGTYAFVAEFENQPQIYLGFIYSDEIQQVTNIKEGACQPDWAPDGKKLVFISPCQNRQKLAGKNDPYAGSGMFLIDVESGAVMPIPSLPGGDFDPDWSPDGEKIVYTSIRNQFAQIFIYRVTTDTADQITNTTSGNRQPAWSPDGKTIAYSTNRAGVNQIWVMDSDGNNNREFSILANGSAILPTWSPDGKEILYSQTNSLRLAVKIFSNTNSIEEVINPRVNLTSNPVFSPDGNWILFDSNMDGSHRIYRMNKSGSGVEPLTPENQPSYQPDWRP